MRSTEDTSLCNSWALQAHHFRSMAPEAILKSPDNLNPKVTGGPFMMSESVPGDHYAVVRNPFYYQAKEGLPYLDKVMFRAASTDTALKDLQAGAITSNMGSSITTNVQEYQHFSNNMFVYLHTGNAFEAMYFNFHNQILANHQELRQAMAMAIDQQALITVARQGNATPLCTDHPSAVQPGYLFDAECPVFDPIAANQLLSDNG